MWLTALVATPPLVTWRLNPSSISFVKTLMGVNRSPSMNRLSSQSKTLTHDLNNWDLVLSQLR